MVQAVETLGAGLKLGLLVQRNEFNQRAIHVRVVRTVELERASISVGSSSIKRKRRRVQPKQAIRGVGIRVSN